MHIIVLMSYLNNEIGDYSEYKDILFNYIAKVRIYTDFPKEYLIILD